MLLLSVFSYSQGIRIDGIVVLHKANTNNIFAGEKSGNKVYLIANSLVKNNTGIGYSSLGNLTGGINNTAVGAFADGQNIKGNNNVWIGYNAGNNSAFQYSSNIGGIDNTNSTEPLLFFKFLEDSLIVNYYMRIKNIVADSIFANYYNAFSGGGDSLWFLDDSIITNVLNYPVRIDSKLYIDSILHETGYMGEYIHIYSPVEIADEISLKDSYIDGEEVTNIWFNDARSSGIMNQDTNMSLICLGQFAFYAGPNIFRLDSTGFYPSTVPGANAIPIGRATDKWKGLYTTNIIDDSTNVFLNVPYKECDTVLGIENDTIFKTIASGGDTSLWYYVPDDTIKTYHHVVVDSSFVMRYKGAYFGYDPLNQGTRNVSSIVMSGDTSALSYALGQSNTWSAAIGVANLSESGNAVVSTFYTPSTEHYNIIASAQKGLETSAIFILPNQIEIESPFVLIQSDSTVIDGDLTVTGLDSASYDYQLYYDKTTGDITYDSAGTGGGIVGDTCFWARSTGDLYPKTIADSIGIGKNNPDEMLDVNGNIQIPTTSATVGIIKQNGSPLIHTKGTGNYFFGLSNGNFTLSGATYNVGIGGNGLKLLSSGDQNISIGYTALEAVSSGGSNIGIGYAAVSKIQTASNTIGVGMNCFQNTSAGNNTGIGHFAGQDISTGTDNVAVGAYALNNSTSSFYNVAIGVYAMGNAGSEQGKADNEVAIGYQAAYTDSTGTGNVSIGYKANWATISGTNNTFIGTESGYSNKGNSSSTAIGYRAMYNTDNRKAGRETYNTAVGYEALKGSGTVASNTGQNNTAIGYQSLYSTSSGYENSAVGTWSLTSNTTGALNSAFGHSSLVSNSTGSFNCAFGDGALSSNVGGISNCAFGISSLASNTGDVNCAFGSSSLISNIDGQGNSGFGNGVLYNNASGNFNTALGASSMYGTYGYSQTGNVAIGYMTLRDINDGADYNTIVGYMAADSLTTGKRNVIIGNEAGGQLTTESDRLMIDNTSTTSPLIGGDFSTNTVYINDILILNAVDTAASIPGSIYIDSDDNDLWYYKDGVGWVKLN